MKKTSLLFYCICLLVFFEGSSRLLIAMPSFFERIRIECDSIRRLEWIKYHKEPQIGVCYTFDDYDPTKGWKLKPGIKDMSVFESKILNSNSKGIRGNLEYKYRKNPDKTRILVLGDSYTFGEDASDNETYPYHLQQMLPRAEVINFGIHGYGHDQMLVYFKEEGIKYKPDIVVLGFLSMDMDRNMLEFRDYAKPKFELVNNELKLRNSPVPTPAVVLREEFWRLKLLDLLSILYHKYLVRSGLYEKRKNEISKAILNELVTTIKGIGAVPVFVYLDELANKNGNVTLTEKEFFGYWQKKGAHCISLRPYSQSAIKKGVEFSDGGHFNSEGNQIVAQGISGYLVNINR